MIYNILPRYLFLAYTNTTLYCIKYVSGAVSFYENNDPYNACTYLWILKVHHTYVYAYVKKKIKLFFILFNVLAQGLNINLWE